MTHSSKQTHNADRTHSPERVGSRDHTHSPERADSRNHTQSPDKAFPARIRVIDSHTEGEPTRVVVQGWPELRGETMQQRRADLLDRFDHLRSAVVCEPRGHDAIVGALLTDPIAPGSTAGVIFFNNVGCLGMCGHGLIGVVTTLAWMDRIEPGTVRIDTPAGTVSAELGENGAVTIRNVPSYCYGRGVRVDVPDVGPVVGDVAYGGNWFFIAHVPYVPIRLDRLSELTDLTQRIRTALTNAGVTGAYGAEIDHIELYENIDSGRAAHDFSGRAARNFVLCPGGAYDRSPCGTGTSAKLAVLHAAGDLGIGEEFRQESVTSGVFTGWLERAGDDLIPHIRGRAFITGENTLHFDPADPFISGFTAAS